MALEGSGFTFENPNAKAKLRLRKVVRLSAADRRQRDLRLLWKEVRAMLVESEDRSNCRHATTSGAGIIKAVIEEIRPNLQRDGGDCQLIEIDGNKIMVKLTGACVFCKLSSATLEGIQSRVVERLGELVRTHPGRWPAAKARH